MKATSAENKRLGESGPDSALLRGPNQKDTIGPPETLNLEQNEILQLADILLILKNAKKEMKERGCFKAEKNIKYKELIISQQLTMNTCEALNNNSFSS